MTPPVDQRQELASLISAFRQNLGHLAEHGCRWLPAAASPRFGVAGVEASPPPVDPGAGPSSDSEASQARHELPYSPGDQELGAEIATADQLEGLRRELSGCERCRLAGTRHNVVFGVGAPQADLMFIGEAPGGDEDRQGVPFVGAAGQLLDKMIKAMGMTREEVYIANIIKCRPPQNRDPSPDEMDTCEPYLHQQIQLIGPKLIVAMGNFAARRLLRTETGISKLRGRFHTYQGVPLMPTFHPAYLLRNPPAKRPVWEDLKAVMAEMDRMKLRRRR